MDRYDVAVVGAGIVGLATAHALQRGRPDLSIAVLEKETTLAIHQTGRNSGVIHAGLYYEPGSMKARLSVAGRERLFEFCAERGIATTQTGKVVIATDHSQLPALAELERRARENGVVTERLGPEGIRAREPHARGVEGLWVTATGAVDFAEVASAMARDLQDEGASIIRGFELGAATRTGETIELRSTSHAVAADAVVNCGGLHVDRVAATLGVDPQLKILPFRGEYYGLTPEGSALVKGHIYPVPDPRLPHLGVHFTRSVRGEVEVGPNAVWAWGREAYGRVSGNPRDAWETLTYRGFWNLARTHWKTGMAEQWRSLSQRAFVADARALVPELDRSHLGAWRSGIRAQAVDSGGRLVHDFVIQEGPGVVNVLNAPSPAATACLTIGEHIAGRTQAVLAG